MKQEKRGLRDPICIMLAYLERQRGHEILSFSFFVLYENGVHMGKKVNHVLTFGIKVWIFAESLMFKKEWDRVLLLRRKTLFR